MQKVSEDRKRCIEFKGKECGKGLTNNSQIRVRERECRALKRREVRLHVSTEAERRTP